MSAGRMPGERLYSVLIGVPRVEALARAASYGSTIDAGERASTPEPSSNRIHRCIRLGTTWCAAVAVSRDSNGNAGEFLSSIRVCHRTPDDWSRHAPNFQPSNEMMTQASQFPKKLGAIHSCQRESAERRRRGSPSRRRRHRIPPRQRVAALRTRASVGGSVVNHLLRGAGEWSRAPWGERIDMTA